MRLFKSMRVTLSFFGKTIGSRAVRVFGWAVLAGFAAVHLAQAQNNSEGAPPPAQNVYQSLSVGQGVYNDGKAALWDLDVFDHFHYFGPAARAKGYRPEQPIKYSHVTHVQTHKMECQYCHWSVTKAAYAAIPEVQACLGCHTTLVGSTPEQQKEIAKISAYAQKGEPIPWVKVHVMPNFVRFNHKRHVKGGLSCQECHGQVPVMEVVERVSSMKMGWCVSCHRERGASIDCFTCHY